MRYLRGTLAIAAVLTIAAAARADDILVPQDYRKLQDAVDAARPGDRVVVSRGRHRGPVVVAKDGIDIVGDRARIVGGRTPGPGRSGGRPSYDGRDGSRDPAMVVLGDRVSVSGLTLQKGGLVVSGDDAAVVGCTVERLGGPGIETGTGIIVNGDRADILGNSVNADRLSQGNGIAVEGSEAVVEGNVVTDISEGSGIHVTGEGFVVSGNTLDDIGTQGSDGWCPAISVDTGEGEGGLVEGNTVVHGPTTGYVARGSGITVTDNDDQVTPAWRDRGWGGFGYYVEGRGNTVDGNGAVGGGFIVFGDGNTVTGNGSQDTAPGFPGFDVEGSGNTVTGNDTVETGGNGFTVVGDDNFLQDDTVQGSDEEGIQVASGEGNEVDDCSATGCDSCGFGNWGTETVVTDSTFVFNWTDVINGGTFESFEGNTYETGDPFSGGDDWWNRVDGGDTSGGNGDGSGGNGDGWGGNGDGWNDFD